MNYFKLLPWIKVHDNPLLLVLRPSNLTKVIEYYFYVLLCVKRVLIKNILHATKKLASQFSNIFTYKN